MTNFTLPENVTTVAGLFTYTDTITYGSLGLVLALSIFIVAFVSIRFSGNEISKSIAGALAITTFLSIFLRVLGLLSDIIFIPMIVLTAISILTIYFSD